MNGQRRPQSWIGVDLDGTLAMYEGFIHSTHIGEPIIPMVERIKEWIHNGVKVKIFTARVAPIYVNLDGTGYDIIAVTAAIQDWTERHIGHRLEVTCMKDFYMVELWDDRAVRVKANTGMPCCEYTKGE